MRNKRIAFEIKVITSCRLFFTGFLFFGLQECFKRKGEKEREKLGGQKDMSERRIATDLYYYYGEIG